MIRMRSPFVNFLWAVGWFTLSLVIGCGNDVAMKYMNSHINPWQTTFFRCFFGTLTLIPCCFYQDRACLRTTRPWLHVVRGMLFCMAMSFWSHGIQEVPIVVVTIVSFTVPLFVLLLSLLFLKERVTGAMWAATLLSFGGILIALQPSYPIAGSSVLLLVLAAMLFGLLDVINKKYIVQESMFGMLFYATLVATLLLAFPALWGNPMPTKRALLGLLGLGIGSNLILYLLLKAFRLTHIAALAPFRYLELLISIGLGYVFFQEIPTTSSYLGAMVVVPCTLFVVYHQHRMHP